jgi:hypothetical protein
MAEPSDSGCKTTRAMVIAWYNQYLGRAPENEGAIIGRVGQDCEAVRLGIANSEEAEAYARRGDTGSGSGPTTPLPKPIEKAKDDILSGVLSQLLNAILPIKGVSDEILAALDKQIDETFPVLSKALDNINRQLDASINSLIPDTIALVGAALGGVETLVATVLSNQADIGDIGEMIGDMASGAKIPFLDSIMELLIGPDFNLAGELGKKISDGLMSDDGPIVALVGMVAKSIERQRNA